jgi:hypothetical protein
LRFARLIPILHHMGGSPAEAPTQPDAPPAGAVRASDADRDDVVARLTEEFAAGRLSHDTFMYRMNAVLTSRHMDDLPPLVADLPAGVPDSAAPAPGRAAAPAPGRAAALAGRLRAAWRRSRPAALRSGVRPSLAGGHPVRRLTAVPHADEAAGDPAPLEFPRGTGDAFSIGRHGSCDLVIADMTVSRVHARLERAPDGWLLTDLSSTNGTRVNGWRVRGQIRVRAGDLVSFGDVRYSLTASTSA